MESRAVSPASSSAIYKKPGRPSNAAPATPLAELRRVHSLTLRDVQEATGINVAVWSQIERGLMVPQPRHLAALARVFDVPLAAWRIRFVLEAETT